MPDGRHHITEKLPGKRLEPGEFTQRVPSLTKAARPRLGARTSTPVFAPTRLLDQLHAQMRHRHYSPRAEEIYPYWAIFLFAGMMGTTQYARSHPQAKPAPEKTRKTPISIAVPARSMRLSSRLAKNSTQKPPRYTPPARQGRRNWG